MGRPEHLECGLHRVVYLGNKFMLVDVKNENYGSEVATHDDWVVVGNPSSYKYNLNSSSFWRTGSLDVYKYNTLTDQHDLLLTLFKPLNGGDEIILAEDTSSTFIHTDIYKTRWFVVMLLNTPGGGLPQYRWIGQSLSDAPIQIDAVEYSSTFEDDYGHSMDVFNNVLAVGCRYYNQNVSISDKVFYATGSSVDIYNLSLLYSTPVSGYVGTGSAFLTQIVAPPSGEPISGSFGHSVSINDTWLAVGSPSWNNTLGSVHMYRRNSPGNPDNLNFTFYQTITGSSLIVGDSFGYSLDINKQTGSYSGSLIVGCGNKVYAGSKVYFFEFDGVNWKESHTFQADRQLYKLPFYNVNPIPRCEGYSTDGFGNSVALFADDVAIGAPTDRWVYEYSGSRAYKQGAAYLFHRCDDHSRGWNMVKKFYGTDKTLKNNKMGYAVDIWDDKFVLGNPKSNADSMTSCYIEGSIFQQNYCYSNLENYIHGQWIFMQKNTASAETQWDVLNTYQRKKRFMTPFRSFGKDVAIANKSIVVGAPMTVYDANRRFNISNTASFVGTDLIPLDDLSGKAYIYNLENFRNEFNVGNVFYRNGKIVLNTSGSIFEGIWFNPITEYNYEYEVHFDSKQTLYEKQIACVVEPGEFNTSTNPTSISREKSVFDLNGNGYFDWQDLDIILRYMNWLNTKYDSAGPSTAWSSSLLRDDDEISFYNFQSKNNAYYNTEHDFVSQSFFKILNTVEASKFDFNQDSKIDSNDMFIFWKYYSNRLNQLNYSSYITPNSKRKLFSDIIDYLDDLTKIKSKPNIKTEFLTYTSQSMSDKTGSYLAPYVTSIGLYNGLDLVAVAKLGTPIKLTKDFPINFIVKMDF